MANLPILQPRCIMGIRTDLEGNALFVSDDDILYPVGAVLTLHNIHQKKQKYIKFSDKGKNVSSIHVSPNKKLISVVERAERPFVNLYCPITFKRKRQLVLPPDLEVNAKEIVAFAFTHDSKKAVIVTGEPDWMFYCFQTDKGRMESSVRVCNVNGSGVIRQVCTNPNDVNQIAVIGESLIKFMGCVDYVWRQFGYSKSEQMDLTTAVWLSQERLLVGTADGKLIIFESGELKATYHANDLPIMNLKFTDEMAQSSNEGSLKSEESVQQFHDENIKVSNLINFPRGFAFAYLDGTVHLYERETPHKFKKRNVFKIPNKSIERNFGDDREKNALEVNCLSINPAQDRLMVTCKQRQLYSVRLWLQDMNANPEVPFQDFGPTLHNGPIGSIAVCSWKPICLTAGETDRTLMVWNYESQELELIQTFQDDVFAVALHPTGLYCTVGFSDKLRFITIMIDEFLTNREFPIRTCRFCSFSNMGQLFAAANGNIIQVYSTISYEMLYNLKGHGGRITGISWKVDDLTMASCGSEGAVYEWWVPESKRVYETIIKSCPFNGVVITHDGKSIYSVGDDGHIRELRSSNIHRDVILIERTRLDDIVLSRLNTMLFVAGNAGTVYSIRIPLLEKAEFVEYIMHSTNIVKMVLSFDDRYLITATVDGNLCFWKLLNTEGKAIKMDKDFKPSCEILISRVILEDKLNQIRDLKLRMHELETEHAYQMRQNDTMHSLRMRDIHAGYRSAIEELKEKNESMEADHVQEINNINMDIARMRGAHEAFVQNLEASYNEKLIFEFEKYRRLEEKMEKMRSDYDKQIEDLNQAKKDSEEAISNDFLERLRDKQMQLDELEAEIVQNARQHEMIKQQIEDDADREIYEMKTHYEKELKEEQDINVKTRSETTMYKKKLVSCQKEIDDLKHQVYTLENEQMQYKSAIVNLEKDLVDMRKEISERDATIQDKEKRIFELKSKNQELEKFKFILDFKIKELIAQIEPKERTIKEQIEQINEMVSELENLQKVIVNLDVQIAELKEKLRSSDNEVRKEISKNRRMKDVLKTIRTDIHQASGYVQNIPMLTKCIKDMYHKYNADKDFATSHTEDVEAKNEFLRQREFLERTVATLQVQATKGSTTLGRDKIKLLQENADLITETNMLRKDLKQEQRKNQRVSSVLGFGRKNVPPKVAEERINRATATRQEIRDSYKKIIEEGELAIEAMKDENNRLLTRLTDDIIGECSEPDDLC